ncbi:hypothetical protein U9M48_019618, partial [Paspalum notatum var. saurae]
MEKQPEKNGGEESNKEGGSADQKAQDRPTYLVFKGARNNFSRVVFSMMRNLRGYVLQLEDVVMFRREMKRSKRIAGKKKINYAESSVSKGGTINSNDSDYPDDDHEEVSSVHVVPSIDTYHLGGGDGQRCCAKCREAIRALLRKNSDTFTVIDDLEDGLSTEMIGIRRDAYERRSELYAKRNATSKQCSENINFKLYNPRYYQPNEVWNEPEVEEPAFYEAGEKIHSMIQRMAGSGTPKM